MATEMRTTEIKYASGMNSDLRSSMGSSSSKPCHEIYKEAVAEARKGLEEGGIPIGSVLVHKGKVIGRGHNQRVQQKSVIRHAEMDCLENAGRQTAEIYSESLLYTTLSPCSMCTGAILLYKIPCVVVGENINFKGEEGLLKENGVHVIVLNDKETIEMFKQFTSENPLLWAEDIGL